MTLRSVRMKRRFTQVTLSKRAGVTQGAISHIETGRRMNPSDDTVKKLAKALRVKRERLFPLSNKV